MRILLPKQDPQVHLVYETSYDHLRLYHRDDLQILRFLARVPILPQHGIRGPSELEEAIRNALKLSEHQLPPQFTFDAFELGNERCNGGGLAFKGIHHQHKYTHLADYYTA